MSIKSSGNIRIGSQNHSSPELLQVHKKIELSNARRERISSLFEELYRQGLSLSDISKQTGKAKNTIRDTLIRSGIELRSNISTSFLKSYRKKAKGSASPVYGFCYFQGQVMPDPREFDTLQLIHLLWTQKTNPNRIANVLNEKRIPSRTAKKWTRNSILKIISRFENQQIILKSGGKYELR